MAKVTLTTITSGYAAVDALNANFTAIANALENTVSRDGTTPNGWTATQDANSQRLINLSAPSSATEPVRVQDVEDLVAGTPTAALTSIVDVAGYYTATDVEGALAEAREYTDTGDATNATNLTNHLNDTVDAHDASAISVSAVAGLAATEVQAAVAELHTDIDNHIADGTAAHAASAIGVTPAGNLASTDVQAALVELQGDVDTFTALGVGQTWQNVSGSRVVGTIYTNSTGKPIMVAISDLLQANIVTTPWFEVDGVTVGYAVGSGASANMSCYIYAVVPDGAQYRLLSVTGLGSAGTWIELR